MSGRSPGDAETVYASTEKAERELNWKYASLDFIKHEKSYLTDLYTEYMPLNYDLYSEAN